MTGVILFRAQPFYNGHLSIVKTEQGWKIDNNIPIFKDKGENT